MTGAQRSATPLPPGGRPALEPPRRVGLVGKAHHPQIRPVVEHLVQRFKALGDSVLGTDGLLTTRSNGLRDSISRHDKDQKRLEDRIARVQARLLRQYSALDTSLNQLNGLGGLVQQQITHWNKTSER